MFVVLLFNFGEWLSFTPIDRGHHDLFTVRIISHQSFVRHSKSRLNHVNFIKIVALHWLTKIYTRFMVSKKYQKTLEYSYIIYRNKHFNLLMYP
jgi:hypothetical protein